MRLKTVFTLLKETFDEWNKDKASRLAAALAYYTVFSLSPLLIIAIAIAGAVFGEEAARGEIVGQIQGLIFIALTFTDVRRLLIKTIPNTIKHSTAAGIGLFIAYIGLSGDPTTGGAGLIVANEATKTAFGSLAQPATLMAVAGLLLTSAFVVRRVRGALLLGIFATAVLAWILGVAAPPQGIFALPQLPTDLFGQAITGLAGLNASNIIDWLTVLFVFLFVDVFDAVGN